MTSFSVSQSIQEIKDSLETTLVCSALRGLVTYTNDYDKHPGRSREILRTDPDFISDVLCSLLARGLKPLEHDNETYSQLDISTITQTLLLIRNLSLGDSTRNSLLCDRTFLGLFFDVQFYSSYNSLAGSQLVRESWFNSLLSSKVATKEEVKLLIHAYIDAAFALTSIKDGDPVRNHFEILRGCWVPRFCDIVLYSFDDFCQLEDAAEKWSKIVLQLVLADTLEDPAHPALCEAIVKLLSEHRFASNSIVVETLFFAIYHLVFDREEIRDYEEYHGIAGIVFADSQFLTSLESIFQLSSGAYLKSVHGTGLQKLMERLKDIGTYHATDERKISESVEKWNSSRGDDYSSALELERHMSKTIVKIYSVQFEEEMKVKRNENKENKYLFQSRALPSDEKEIFDSLSKMNFYNLHHSYRWCKLFNLLLANEDFLLTVLCNKRIKLDNGVIKQLTQKFCMDIFSPVIIGRWSNLTKYPVLVSLCCNGVACLSQIDDDLVAAAIAEQILSNSNDGRPSPFLSFFHAITHSFLRNEDSSLKRSAGTLAVINSAVSCLVGLLTKMSFAIDWESSEGLALFKRGNGPFFGTNDVGEKSDNDDQQPHTQGHPECSAGNFVRDCQTLLEFASSSNADLAGREGTVELLGALFFFESRVPGAGLQNEKGSSSGANNNTGLPEWTYMNDKFVRLMMGTSLRQSEHHRTVFIGLCYFEGATDREEGEVLLRNKRFRDALVVALKKRCLTEDARVAAGRIICNLSDEPDECQEIFATRIMRDAILGAIVRPYFAKHASTHESTKTFYEATINIFSDGETDSLELFCKSPLIVDAFLLPMRADSTGETFPAGCHLIGSLMRWESGKRLFAQKYREFREILQIRGASAPLADHLEDLVVFLEKQYRSLPESENDLSSETFISSAAAAKIQSLELEVAREESNLSAERLAHKKSLDDLRKIHERVEVLFDKVTS